MIPPSITDAKKLAAELRSRGVLVLSFDKGQYGAASYGHKRATCDAMKQVTDRICELIEQCVIRIPDELSK
jgi:hypothetical protein